MVNPFGPVAGDDFRDPIELVLVDQKSRVDVAGSAMTRSRRQAGPPPLAIDWRTSTTSTRRIGPLPATWRSIQLHTDGVSRASAGRISVVSPAAG